jgi:type IV secretion system protein VirD4
MTSPSYRTPKNPGYLGGWNWKPMVLGLLMLLAINAITTQWLAHKFQFQPALGGEIYRAPHFVVYEPFHWMWWVLKYSSSNDPGVRGPMLQAVMMSIMGYVMTIGLYLLVIVRRNRKLGEGNEDIHGSARFANGPEIRESGLLGNDNGVFVGGWVDEAAGRLHYLRHNGPEHVLAFAPTRSGKGVSLVIPTLLAWTGSAVVYDIKGENWAKTAGYRASAGQTCMKFSPVEESGSRWNPLAEIRLYTARDVSDAQNVAGMIVRNGEDSASERYWQDAAESIMTGMILHACYEAAVEGRVACPADLAGILTRPGQTFRDTLNEIISFPHDPQRAQNWHMPTGERTATHPVVREKAQEMLDKEDKDFSGVLSTAKTALTLFSDPLVARNTSASDFSINDLVNHEHPVSLYIVVPPSDKIRLRPIVRLMFTMIVNRLTEKMDFQNGADMKNRHRLLFLVDEFPSLKNMQIFADALSYMASYGLHAYLIAQDVRQIVDAYGDNESIISNCHVRAAFAPNQLETAELLSRMTGKRTIQRASFSYSGTRMSPILGQMSANVDHVERELMTPDEVLRLRPAQKQGTGDTERITEGGDMLIFVAGRYPIYGRQMLYFQDPVLLERTKIAPPKALYQIEPGGALIAQKPVDRTRRVISAPDHIDAHDETSFTHDIELRPVSAMERGFNEELNNRS